jgi:hypothetical protein
VVKRFRRDRAAGDPGLASPQEFLQYVLADLARGHQRVDQHWRPQVSLAQQAAALTLPQHLGCPFCGLQFTVYGRMEELDQDSAYFFRRANLTGLIDTKLHSNMKDKVSEKGLLEKQFWEGVDAEILEQLSGEAGYKTDLEMFDYSVQDYLASIELDIVLEEDDLPKV